MCVVVFVMVVFGTTGAQNVRYTTSSTITITIIIIIIITITATTTITHHPTQYPSIRSPNPSHNHSPT
jgi:hypothetical protein